MLYALYNIFKFVASVYIIYIYIYISFYSNTLYYSVFCVGEYRYHLWKRTQPRWIRGPRQSQRPIQHSRWVACFTCHWVQAAEATVAPEEDEEEEEDDDDDDEDEDDEDEDEPEEVSSSYMTRLKCQLNWISFDDLCLKIKTRENKSLQETCFGVSSRGLWRSFEKCQK